MHVLGSPIYNFEFGSYHTFIYIQSYFVNLYWQFYNSLHIYQYHMCIYLIPTLSLQTKLKFKEENKK